MYQQGSKLDARVASKKSIDFLESEIYEISRLLDDKNRLIDGNKKIRFEIGSDIGKEYRELFDTSGTFGKVVTLLLIKIKLN